MLKLFSNPDEAIGNSGSATGTSKDMSVSDMEDFLKETPEDEVIPLETPKKKEKESEKEDEEESEEGKETEEEPEEDELEELVEELAEPNETKFQLVTPVRRKEILKKYPNVFKDFPYLEAAYYREQQFTQVFPTIDEAKQASEAVTILKNFESEVMKGDTENILKSVKDNDPNSFNKLVDEYLPTLAKVDQNAYLHVVGNVAKQTIIGMIQEAQRLGIGSNEQPGAGAPLQMAAQILNQFIFGSSQFQPPSNLSKPVKEEDKAKETELSRREQQFRHTQFESARNALNTRVTNQFKATIDANIDPNNSMTDYVKKTATREVEEELGKLLMQDTRFRTTIDKLWENVFNTNFSPDAVDKVRQAFIARGKVLLPSVLKKARNNAYRGMGRKVREESTESQTSNKGPVKGGRPVTSSNTGRKSTDPKEIPRGMTTLEFLNKE